MRNKTSHLKYSFTIVTILNSPNRHIYQITNNLVYYEIIFVMLLNKRRYLHHMNFYFVLSSEQSIPRFVQLFLQGRNIVC